MGQQLINLWQCLYLDAEIICSIWEYPNDSIPPSDRKHDSHISTALVDKIKTITFPPTQADSQTSLYEHIATALPPTQKKRKKKNPQRKRSPCRNQPRPNDIPPNILIQNIIIQIHKPEPIREIRNPPHGRAPLRPRDPHCGPLRRIQHQPHRCRAPLVHLAAHARVWGRQVDVCVVCGAEEAVEDVGAGDALAEGGELYADAGVGDLCYVGFGGQWAGLGFCEDLVFGM